MEEVTIIQISRCKQIKSIHKFLLGKTDETIPLILDHANRSMKIDLLYDKCAFFIELDKINYHRIINGKPVLSTDVDKSVDIVPFRVKDLEDMYKKLKSSKIIDMCFKYIKREDSETLEIICSLDDGKNKVVTPIIIIRNDNECDIEVDNSGYTNPTILNSSSIIVFDSMISKISKSTQFNDFDIHYTDNYFSISFNNQVDKFGFEWKKNKEDGDYISSSEHKCNAVCNDISINKIYCTNVLSKIKTMNKTQLSLSFKTENDTFYMKIDYDIDVIGKMSCIIFGSTET